MARPIKKGLEYFSHDVEMSSDIKIKKLEAKFGLTGYAIYNKILEQQYKYAGEFNLMSEDNLRLYSKEWKISRANLKKITEECIALNLFENENLLSNSITERLERINEKRSSARNRKIMKNDQCNENNSLEIVFTEENAQSKVKESKEKQSSVCITHTLEFETLHNYLRAEKDFAKLKEYDLEYYFNRVTSFYPDKNFTLKEMKSKIIFFIENDKKSDKHEPKRIPKQKKDSAAVAFGLVQSNLDWIKNLPDKDPVEVVPELVKKCSDPARYDALFECYVEKALRHYLPTVSS